MKVLLVGLGRMGQRYIRVLNQLLGAELEITAVDPLAPPIPGIKIISELSEANDSDYNLAIDSHPNQGRYDIFKYFNSLGIKKAIIEKPLASSWEEAQKIAKLASDNSVEVMSPFYNRFAAHFSKDLLNQLAAGRLNTVSITGGALGIGCNGIHYIDLCNYLFESSPESVYASLSLNSLESPRGKQFRDHGGLIVSEYAQGRSIIDLSSSSSVGVCIQLTYENGKIIIHDQTNPKWFWFRRPLEYQDQPIFRSSYEELIEPPIKFGASVEELMKPAIKSFLNQEKVPGIKESLEALKALGLATASSELKHSISWNEEKHLNSLEFSFT